MNKQSLETKMSNNNIIKHILDIVMSILLVLLMRTSFTGITLHEVIGLFLFFLFLIHKFLNFSWIKAVISNFSSGKIKTKTKVMLFLDLILFVFITLIVISGILISQIIFPGIAVENIIFWSELHHFTSYSSLILISVHIGLHWQMIMNAFKKMFGITGFSKIRTAVCRVLSLAIVVIGIKSMFTSNIILNFSAPFTPDETIQKVEYISKDSSNESAYGVTLLSANTLVIDDIPTLDDYLSKLICTGCSRRCPLTALRCSRGESYKATAVQEYNTNYASLNTESSLPETSAPNSSQIDDSQSSENDIEESPSSESDNAINDDKLFEDSQAKVDVQNDKGVKTSPLDILAIMGLFIACTYYTISITKNFKRK